MTGWVAIDRGIFEHTFFSREPMSEREAWVWIITRAAWQDTRHRVGRVMVDMPRGSFMVTLREMQHAWMWGSDKRVRLFLGRLKNDGMIGLKTDASGTHKKTQVSVCNYEIFQQVGRKGKHQTDAAGTQPGRTKETREQDNKEQEKKEEAQAPIADKPPPKARLPVDWALSDEGWAYARSQNIPEKVIEDEARGFHAYWSDRRDRDSSKSARGWEQCWEGHCRWIAPRYARGGVAGSPKSFGGGSSPSIASIVAQRRAAGIV